MDPDRLPELARRHGIRLLLQFGSSISGHVHSRSDIDFAVLMDRAPALTAQLDLIGDLQALVPDREVDVAIINRADPLFLKKIVENCRRLYGTERALHELKMYA